MFVHPVYNSSHLRIPNSHSLLPQSPSTLATACLVSVSVTVFLKVKVRGSISHPTSLSNEESADNQEDCVPRKLCKMTFFFHIVRAALPVSELPRSGAVSTRTPGVRNPKIGL